MKCEMKFCPELEATWMPDIVLKAPNGAAMSIVIPVRVCDRHKGTSTVDDFLTDRVWLDLGRAFATTKHVQPDRNLTALRWQVWSAEVVR